MGRTTQRPRRLRHIGRAAATDSNSDIEAEIAALELMDLFQLRETWERFFDTTPPVFRSVEMLRMLLAWRLQADRFGGLAVETKAELARRGPAYPKGFRLGVGSTLKRLWNDETQIVTIVEDGFEWRGRIFGSLSAVANAISGTRWNGPRFFGLRL